jgi:hypothetical protein
MRRLMTGIALAAIGLAASAAFAMPANAAEGTAMFTNWFECSNTGQTGFGGGHKIISYHCYSNSPTQPGGPNAFMVYQY